VTWIKIETFIKSMVILVSCHSLQLCVVCSAQYLKMKSKIDQWSPYCRCRFYRDCYRTVVADSAFLRAQERLRLLQLRWIWWYQRAWKPSLRAQVPQTRMRWRIWRSHGKRTTRQSTMSWRSVCFRMPSTTRWQSLAPFTLTLANTRAWLAMDSTPVNPVRNLLCRVCMYANNFCATVWSPKKQLWCVIAPCMNEFL